MSKKPVQNTTTRKPVAAGRSPITPARAVRLERDAEHGTPVAAPTGNAGERITEIEREAQQEANRDAGQGAAPQFSDTVARARARDLVEIPPNPKLEQARADLDAAMTAQALSNWEVAMIESMIDLRDLQDVIDAHTARQDVIRENIKLALAGSEAKTFKFNLGAATLAKGAETVTIVDEKKIPFAFMHSVPDKTKISKALRVPIEVDGAKLVEGKPSLRINWED